MKLCPNLKAFENREKYVAIGIYVCCCRPKFMTGNLYNVQTSKIEEIFMFQLNAFRELVGHGKEETTHNVTEDKFHIVDNFRPTLPLNDRRVLASFSA